MSEIDRPEFWDELYRQGTTGWDLGGSTPAFVQLLHSAGAPASGRMLVPGCGRGHDAILFARYGFDVLAVDYAASAVADAVRLARAQRVTCNFLVADLFDLPKQYPRYFDYVLEYVCFCAIPPDRRDEYVRAMAEVLRPDGELLGLFFPVLPAPGGPAGPGTAMAGPPFPMTEAEIRARFSARFDILRLAPTPHSIKPRQGRELLARFRRR